MLTDRLLVSAFLNAFDLDYDCDFSLVLQYTWIEPWLLPRYRSENSLITSDHGRHQSLLKFTRRLSPLEGHGLRFLESRLILLLLSRVFATLGGWTWRLLRLTGAPSKSQERNCKRPSADNYKKWEQREEKVFSFGCEVAVVVVRSRLDGRPSNMFVLLNERLREVVE
jgi:hypothetical protein